MFGNPLSHLYADTPAGSNLGLAHLFAPLEDVTRSDLQPKELGADGSITIPPRLLKRTSSQMLEKTELEKTTKQEYTETASFSSSSNRSISSTQSSKWSRGASQFLLNDKSSALTHLPPAHRRIRKTFPNHRTPSDVDQSSTSLVNDLPARPLPAKRPKSPLADFSSDLEERTPSPGPSDPTYLPYQPGRKGSSKPSRGKTQRASASSSNDHHSIVMSQIKEVFKRQEDGTRHPYTLAEFRAMVLQRGYNGQNYSSNLEREVEVMRRVIAGYVKASDEEIVTAFAYLSQSSIDSSSSLNSAMKLNQIEDPCERMVQRERLLFNELKRSKPGLTTFSWLTNLIISNIEALEVVADFDRKVRLKFTKFTKEEDFGYLRHSMSRRRHFWTLYKEFGATVLLDPYLLDLTEAKFPRGSKYFSSTIDGVLQRAEGKEKDRNFYSENRGFLLGVVRALGGSDFEAYVEDFLNRSQCPT